MLGRGPSGRRQIKLLCLVTGSGQGAPLGVVRVGCWDAPLYTVPDPLRRRTTSRTPGPPPGGTEAKLLLAVEVTELKKHSVDISPSMLGVRWEPACAATWPAHQEGTCQQPPTGGSVRALLRSGRKGPCGDCHLVFIPCRNSF